MNTHSLSKKSFFTAGTLSFVLVGLVMSMLVLAHGIVGQGSQLSLADILIALRSKKVTLVERNKLLTGAVRDRGITFALTPEIEKELTTGGADAELISAIKQRSSLIKISASVEAKPAAAQSTPSEPVMDGKFFEARGNTHFTKGEFDRALADYTKVIELKEADASVYLNRGIVYAYKGNADRAIGDFDKAIELDPKEPIAYVNRGMAYEKVGNVQRATSDFQKALELDGNNLTAKAGIKRLTPEPPKPEPTEVAAVAAADTKAPADIAQLAPEFVEVGAMNQLATRLAIPIYPAFERRMRVQGMVVVQITLDEEGKVVSAKAASGPKSLRAAAEDAVRNSRFKPALFADKPIKSTGFISYNFKADN